MTEREPTTELDARYSDDGATATPWAQARDRLAAAELYWITTVRADGRPHVTPLIGMWLDGAMVFTTGPEEQKARNLAHDGRCALISGTDALWHGLDVVVEGSVERITGPDELQRVADAYVAKYGETWRFGVQPDGLTHGEGGVAHPYRVRPDVAYAFGRGEPNSHTRYRFQAP